MNSSNNILNIKNISLITLTAIIISTLFWGCRGSNDKSMQGHKDSTENRVSNHLKPLPVDNNVVAHRGAYRIHGTPGNSLAAFQDAINMHLYGIECDIQLTKDNKLIVYHDSKYHGLTVANSTYSELENSGKLSNGEELPLFKDFLQKALSGKYTRLWVDVKAVSKKNGGDISSAKACIKAMQLARKLKAEYFIAGFLIRTNFIMEKVKSVSKGTFNLAYQEVEKPSYYVLRGYRWASQPKGSFYPDNGLKLRKFHALGIKVNTYEIDHKDKAKWFIKHHVDMIQSNYPKMVMGVLDSLKAN